MSLLGKILPSNADCARLAKKRWGESVRDSQIGKIPFSYLRVFRIERFSRKKWQNRKVQIFRDEIVFLLLASELFSNNLSLFLLAYDSNRCFHGVSSAIEAEMQTTAKIKQVRRSIFTVIDWMSTWKCLIRQCWSFIYTKCANGPFG